MPALTGGVEVAGIRQGSEVIAHGVEALFEAKPAIQLESLLGEPTETKVLPLPPVRLALNVAAGVSLIDCMTHPIRQHHSKDSIKAQQLAAIDDGPHIQMGGGCPTGSVDAVAVTSGRED